MSFIRMKIMEYAKICVNNKDMRKLSIKSFEETEPRYIYLKSFVFRTIKQH